MGWLSQIFNKGHRIRVTIASTGAPFFEPNLNTGGEMPSSVVPEGGIVAENTVRHEAKHQSRVIAPLVSKKLRVKARAEVDAAPATKSKKRGKSKR